MKNIVLFSNIEISYIYYDTQNVQTLIHIGINTIYHEVLKMFSVAAIYERFIATLVMLHFPIAILKMSLKNKFSFNKVIQWIFSAVNFMWVADPCTRCTLHNSHRQL